MRTSFNLITFLVIALIIGGIVFTISGYGNKQTIKTKVTGKERIVTDNGNGGIESYYLIYTEAGSLKLEDEMLYGNFNSSDWYGQIKVDSTYTFNTVGYRIGIMSEYPNIVKFSK